ncbi:MAG: hypothetical protein ACFFER_17490, partial [Candidatus Thorarchaeota archaeon]
MLAKIELIESLHDHRFQSIRQVRPGLFSFPPDLDSAKGQLAASIYTGMLLNPQIVHVVGFTEASHLATADDVIESCRIASRVIYNCTMGNLDPLQDIEIRKRKDELIEEARRCTSYADRGTGLAAVREALVLYAESPEALKERARLTRIESPEARAAREHRERVARLLREAKANDSKANGRTALRKLDELLKLEPSHAEATRLKKKIEDYYRPPPTLTLNCGGGIKMEMVLIPAGKFA